MNFSIPEGKLERIDPPNPEQMNVERCFDIIFQQDEGNPKVFHQRNIFVRKEGEKAYLTIFGLGNDLVWWKHLDTLPKYAFYDLKASETGPGAPRNGWTVLLVTVLVQEIDTGKEEEWRTLVTNFRIRRV